MGWGGLAPPGKPVKKEKITFRNQNLTSLSDSIIAKHGIVSNFALSRTMVWIDFLGRELIYMFTMIPNSRTTNRSL